MTNKLVGIYKIKNTVNGKVYIGQSRNLKRRIADHKRRLKANTHHNDHLQNAYNKYGINSFIYEIIEQCEIDSLTLKELYWIDYYKSHIRELGYNIDTPNVDNTSFSMSEETKALMSEIAIKYSKEELISYLQEYYYHFNKVPTVRELDDNKSLPSSGTYSYAFGDYKQSLIEADLYDFVDNKTMFDRVEYSREDILSKFEDFIDKNKRFPNSDELKKPADYSLPSSCAISRHFKSIHEIREVFNLSTDDIKQTENEEALEQLKLLYEQDGYITSRTIDKSPLTRSAKFYQERFGSLINAYTLIGIYTKKHIEKEIKKFYDTHSRLPNNKDVKEYKLTPKNITALYFTTDELKQLVGIDEEAIKQKENQQALELLYQLYELQGYVDQDSINASKLTKSVKFYCSRFGSLTNACLEANIPLDKLKIKYPKQAI